MSKIISINSDSLVPDVVSQYPSTRAVFDRYGLNGCGGEFGPHEQVGWFARLHGVPVDTLLRDLKRAATEPTQRPIEFSPSVADSIYRPFFLAGIATVLTLGCMWGAINLLTIGVNRNFNSISYSWVLAHGHAMVFGFVGFFIMGFAYQAIPRFKHTLLWQPCVAVSALPIMVLGISLQTIAHLLSPPSLRLEMVAAVLQTIAVVTFGIVIVQTIRQAQKPELYDRFLYSALVWFIVAAIANPIIFKLFELPGSRDQLLFNLATFNIPYRDVQLLGLAVVMILGVSLRLLPHAYGFKEPSRNWISFAFWGVNGTILFGSLFFIVGMTTGNHWLLMLQWITAVVLLAIAVTAPFQYRLFTDVAEKERDRGLKFIRAAFVWFIVATAMLVFTPVYNFAIYMPLTGSRVPFSHAFFGAYRHALTVGFIMMMIVGVSSKIVPTLSGIDVRRTNALWPTFILLNLGNFTRVSFQIATDFSSTAYSVMGISGFVEVVGLTIWGYELYANMRAGKRIQKGNSTTERERQRPISTNQALNHVEIDRWRSRSVVEFCEPSNFNPNDKLEITRDTKVADVLSAYPESLEVFLRHGFAPLSNPLMRRTIARAITIEQACRQQKVDRMRLLDELCAIQRVGRNGEKLVPIKRIDRLGLKN